MTNPARPSHSRLFIVALLVAMLAMLMVGCTQVGGLSSASGSVNSAPASGQASPAAASGGPSASNANPASSSIVNAESTAPASGSFTIQSNPSGANVLVTNASTTIYQGVTPYSASDVPPGSYVVKISKDGYSPLTRFLYVYANPATVLEINLTSLSLINGSFIVNALPEGTQITVSRGTDVYSGPSPLQVDSTTPGIYQVTASQPGYAPASALLIVGTGRLTAYNLTLERMAFGSFNLSVYDSLGFGLVNASITVKSVNGSQLTGTGASYCASNVPIGAYSVILTADGYQPAIENFSVGENQTTAINFTLNPNNPTGFAVYTNPAGAAISIRLRNADNSTVLYSGVSPMAQYGVPAGQYILQVQADGYNSLYRFFDVVQNQNTLLNYSLASPSTLPGSFIVNTLPQGAQITVASGTTVYSGLSPLQVNSTAPGVYQVNAIQSGYAPASGFLIVDGGLLSVYNLTLNAVSSPASVTVNVDPPGANVTVSLAGTTTNYPGNAPFTLDNLSAGNYTIQAYASGYHVNTSLVELLSGQHKDVSLTLQAYAGTSNITVNTVPSGATVSVRSMKNPSLVYSGPSPFTVSNLTDFGTYIISATMPGYQDYLNTTTIQDNQNYDFTAVLFPSPLTGFSIYTDPPGARLSVSMPNTNSTLTYSGLSPMSKYGIPAGRYLVQVQADGYGNAHQFFDVAQDQVALLNFSLIPAPSGQGSLSVDTSPEGAQVHVQSGSTTYDGFSPFFQSNVGVGTYMVSLLMDGYQTQNHLLDVSAGQTAAANYTLHPSG